MKVVMFVRNMFSAGSWLSRGLWAFALVAAVVVASVRAAEADRPSGPNDFSLVLCQPDLMHKPRLCGYFVNTANEDIRIENEATDNGKKMLQLPFLDCPADASAGVSGLITCYINGTIHRPYAGAKIDYGFRTVEVEYGSQYCVSIRARRVSDDMVSVPWSGPTCVTVPPAPAKPALPKFTVSYSSVHGAFATGPAAQATSMVIAPLPVSSVALYQLTISSADGSRSFSTDSRVAGKVAPFEYAIGAGIESVSVKLCESNVTGTTCATQAQSIAGQGAITLPGIPVTAHALPSGAPNYGSPFPGTGSKAVSVLAEQMMVGTDLPGSDYTHATIVGGAADCQARCTADGKCLAWTWVEPGVQNPLAMCWLKNAIPSKVGNGNTTSGIKRIGSSVGVPVP